MQSEPRVRLHGRRHRGFTVPVLDGGPELGGKLIQEMLYEPEKAGASLLRRLAGLTVPCECTPCQCGECK